MMKLPTTFTSLNLEGFDIDRSTNGTVTESMVATACAVLQRNKIGIVVRSVRAALKEIYGFGGSNEALSKLVREWQQENLPLLKSKVTEGDLGKVLIEIADDGILAEAEIPGEFLRVADRMAVAIFRMAYQQADTAIAGDRMKTLAQENDAMRGQLKDFPQLQMEVNFYKSEYDRQKEELRNCYMNLDRQKLADSEEFRFQLEQARAERLELEINLSVAQKRIEELEQNETASYSQLAEFSQVRGHLDAREKEIFAMRSQLQALQSEIGEKQILSAQLAETRSQLAAANQTVVSLQAKQKTVDSLEVDADVTGIMLENETLHGDLDKALQEIEDLKAQLAKTGV
ncbi:MAG: hypothetical protein MUE44_34815 [Oscillatoriaceae cyanobacterium Prado104]|jgi:hypothetical protein|nr:hypothetical protein [Oscillatoriaceae cyanobacterium Prado104]